MMEDAELLRRYGSRESKGLSPPCLIMDRVSRQATWSGRTASSRAATSNFQTFQTRNRKLAGCVRKLRSVAAYGDSQLAAVQFCSGMRREAMTFLGSALVESIRANDT